LLWRVQQHFIEHVELERIVGSWGWSGSS
jgi:hypothetical protein